MSNSTTYLVKVDGAEVASKSKKASAIEVAEGLRSEHPTSSITVETNAGTEVHVVKVKGTHAKPWTRTETHDGIEVEVPAGYVVAYTRKRVGAVVARSEGKDGWLVLTEDGRQLEAKNTVEARELTNDMADDYRTKREAEKLADAEARAAAKTKREADRLEAKAAKEAERTQKAADREAAREAKRLAKEADAEAKRLAKEAVAAAKAAAEVEEPAEATA